MTSAKAGSKTSLPTKAARDLEFALGKNRVYLRELRPLELEALLKTQLVSIDTRELRGFKELKELLCQRRDEESLVVRENPTLCFRGFSENCPFNLKSHVIPVCRGVICQKLTYRRHESDEETKSHMKFREWGHSGYLYQGEERLLLMRRLPELSGSDEHILVEVGYGYTKVSNKNEYLITNISAKPVPIYGFCRHFREAAPDIARGLLWEIASIYRKTVGSFQSKLDSMRLESLYRDRLAESIG